MPLVSLFKFREKKWTCFNWKFLRFIGMYNFILFIVVRWFWVHMVFFCNKKLTMRCLAISSYDRHSKICSNIQSGKSRRFMFDVVLFCITKNFVVFVYNKLNATVFFSIFFPPKYFHQLVRWIPSFLKKMSSSIACCVSLFFHRNWQFDEYSTNAVTTTRRNRW